MNKRLLLLLIIAAGTLLTTISQNGTYAQFTVRTIASESTFSVVDKLPEKACNSDQPVLSLEKSDEKTVRFFLQCMSDKFTKLTYSITYDTDSVTQGVTGSVELSGGIGYASEPIALGTCSGEECVYPENIKNIQIKVDLIDKDNQTLTLTQ